MTRLIPGPYPPEEMTRFLETFLYTPEALTAALLRDKYPRLNRTLFNDATRAKQGAQ